MITGAQKDLIVLVADLDAENAIVKLLGRHESLKVRPFSFEVIRYPGRDAGVRKDCAELLRSYQTTFNYALVIFDHHGSGKEDQSRDALENDREQSLANNGWQDRAAVIVLDPELEIWVWSDSPHVALTLGWPSQDRLRAHLLAKNWLNDNEIKPKKPKEAMKDVLRTAQKSLSASYFSELAQQVSVNRCQDPSFKKFVDTLRNWFPLE
jgi:hypothetical protein